MEIIFDTNGGIRKWLWTHPEVKKANYEACVGWKENNMCAAVGFELDDKNCYIHLVVNNKRWWNKKHLTFIANVCYTYFKKEKIISLSSKENVKIHSVLDRLGFHRRDVCLDGRELVEYSITPKDTLKQKWYRGV